MVNYKGISSEFRINCEEPRMTVQRWKIIIDFDAEEVVAKEIREQLYAMGVNTKRGGFHQYFCTLQENQSSTGSANK